MFVHRASNWRGGCGWHGHAIAHAHAVKRKTAGFHVRDMATLLLLVVMFSALCGSMVALPLQKYPSVGFPGPYKDPGIGGTACTLLSRSEYCPWSTLSGGCILEIWDSVYPTLLDHWARICCDWSAIPIMVCRLALLLALSRSSSYHQWLTEFSRTPQIDCFKVGCCYYYLAQNID